MSLEELRNKYEQSSVLCEVLVSDENPRYYSGECILDDFICQSKSIFTHITELLNNVKSCVWYVVLRTLDYNNNYKETIYELEERNDFSNYATFNFIERGTL